ncbi:MAG: hypothetical protein ACKV0T_25630 [Planctomycetales bacterium]
MLKIPNWPKPADRTKDEWDKHRWNCAIYMFLDSARFLLHRFRIGKWIDTMDWQWEGGFHADPPDAPKTVRLRWQLAHTNYEWLLRSIFELTSDLKTTPELCDLPSGIEIRAILNAAYAELADDLALAEFESVNSPSYAISMLKEKIRNSRRFMEIALPIAIARLGIESGHQPADWSAFLPVKRWVKIFENAGCGITDDTIANRIKSGIYRKHPSSGRTQLSLDTRMLPPEVVEQLRSKTEPKPKFSENGR